MFCSRLREVDIVTIGVAYRGTSAMEYRPSFEQRGAASLDPHDCIREAEIALESGDVHEAAELIAQAYVAFDLFAIDCGDFTDPGMEWPERNS
jgi:hypothetical protein